MQRCWCRSPAEEEQRLHHSKIPNWCWLLHGGGVGCQEKCDQGLNAQLWPNDCENAEKTEQNKTNKKM